MLAPGTLLGPYRVLEKVGEGGMGEVYKARDTRLERTVALKLLTGSAAETRQVRERLQQEARALSPLNHPNICTLYDIAEATPDGSATPVSYLVMEFVDGVTLADRLSRGPLPLDKVLLYGSQIADALDRAHRAGVVHGDLKPANVMIARRGVKLLDFGIAQKRRPGPDPGWADAATRTVDVSAPETIRGTLRYLAPEVLEGRVPDERADIFACGAVLYEMRTGRPAFDGDTAAAVIASVMQNTPAPAGSPGSERSPLLDHLVDTCLAKDPDARWQHAGDLARELRWLHDAAPSPDAAVVPPRALAWPWKVATGVLVASTVALGAGLLLSRRAPSPAPMYKTSVLLPDGLRFPTGNTVGGGGRLALSPDGRSLAVVVSDPTGQQMLWVRPLEGQTAMPLAGTDGASSPFWSPDSRTIGFVAQGQLKTVSANGGEPALLATPALGATGAWNSSGEILFTPAANSPLAVVAATGGTPRTVSTLDPGAGDQVHRNAAFLPDGRHFLFVAVGRNGAAVTRRVLVGSLDGDVSVTVLDNAAGARYADGHLLFVRDTTLYAQPFDVDGLRLTGDARVIAEQIEAGGAAAASFAVSDTGLLAFQPSSQAGTQLTWMDRDGRQLGIVGDAADYGDIELSPDGRSAAVSVLDTATNTRDLWIVDVTRGVRTRFTFDKADDIAPIWSSDGSRVMFTSNRQGHFDLYERAASGTGPETLVFADMAEKYPTSWLSDLGRLLYWTFNTEGTEVHLLSLDGEPRDSVFLPSPVSPGRFSPDGRHVLYYSVESGRSEVYLVPFPARSRKWQISSAGGSFARWRADGGEVYYIGRDNRLVATPVTITGDRVDIGRPTPLFEARPVGVRYPFAVTPDGQRFLVNTVRGADAVTSVTLVQNWSRPSTR